MGFIQNKYDSSKIEIEFCGTYYNLDVTEESGDKVFLNLDKSGVEKLIGMLQKEIAKNEVEAVPVFFNKI